MSQKERRVAQDLQAQAERAASRGDWEAATEFYAQCLGQRASELSLINSVQEGLSSRLDMQGIYDLVGDELRDTFNAQVVMISQFDPNSKRIYHHYAIERGQHLRIQGWQPLDSSRARVIHTRRPLMINLAEIRKLVSSGKMSVVPGTELPRPGWGSPCWSGTWRAAS